MQIQRTIESKGFSPSWAGFHVKLWWGICGKTGHKCTLKIYKSTPTFTCHGHLEQYSEYFKVFLKLRAILSWAKLLIGNTFPGTKFRSWFLYTRYNVKHEAKLVVFEKYITLLFNLIQFHLTITLLNEDVCSIAYFFSKVSNLVTRAENMLQNP